MIKEILRIQLPVYVFITAIIVLFVFFSAQKPVEHELSFYPDLPHHTNVWSIACGRVLCFYTSFDVDGNVLSKEILPEIQGLTLTREEGFASAKVGVGMQAGE